MKNSCFPFKCRVVVFLGSFLLCIPCALAQLPRPQLLEPAIPTVNQARPTHLPPGAEPPEYPTIPATNLPTVPVLPAPVSQPRLARTTAATFAKLTVDFEDGVAVIGGRAPSHEAVWEYVELVRVKPGVLRVIVGPVRVQGG